MNIKNLSLSVAALTLVAVAGTANAEVRRIIQPTFKAGKLEVDYYGAKEPIDSDGQMNHLFGLGYGVSSWLQAKVEAQISEDAEETPDIINGVAQVQFWNKGSMPFDLGLRGTYEVNREEGLDNQLRATLAAAGDIGSVKTTINYNYLVAAEGENEFEDGTTSLAAQAKVAIGKDIYAGAEYYAELGEFGDFDFENQMIGPMVEAKLTSDLSLAGAVLFDISNSEESEDTSARWEARYAF